MDSSYNYEKGKELSKDLQEHVDKYRKNLYKNRKKKLKRNISKEENDNYKIFLNYKKVMTAAVIIQEKIL